ncbi:unnamed protein product [Bursaphelenchus xylophilus]|uniref:(pine wood nematode) hypothetical protein n=1 Tax=Bursaphelenchus xylophilus TaxID=6326 RepID=A0A1I7SME5_BURXY|nr:unnamed protein product [Bursaphelenchus xylophilus]CAG9130152.1 unnamed protein product [Bursaphelenchus xylophilus]
MESWHLAVLSSGATPPSTKATKTGERKKKKRNGGSNRSPPKNDQARARGNHKKTWKRNWGLSLLQCCSTCGQTQVGKRHEQFFKDGVNSRDCFDRHGRHFCEAFIMKRDIWSPANWTCSQPENAHLGFRVCRKSCGYCRRDLYADDQQPVPKSPLPLIELWMLFLIANCSGSAWLLPGAGQTQKMPCCKESIGVNACQELKVRRPYEFQTRCRTDADFAFLQCCKTCRTNVPALGRELFAHGPSSRHCFDRHNHRFCTQFVRKSGMWAGSNSHHSGCNGESSALAFRVCRRSCGFCRPDLYRQDSEEERRCVIIKSERPESTTTLEPAFRIIVEPDK